MVIYNRVLRFEYKQYQRLVVHGEGKVTRGRKNHTENNIQNRRTAENELVAGKISWLVFLQRVSHTNDSMVARLEEDFRQNGNEVDDPRVQLDTNHSNDYLCANCNIEIDQEHRVVLGCGHGSVCWPCVEMIKENPNPKCPMEDCQAIIGNDYIRMK